MIAWQAFDLISQTLNNFFTRSPLHLLEVIVELGALDAGDSLGHELVGLVELLLQSGERKRRHRDPFWKVLEKEQDSEALESWTIKLS